MEPTRSISHLVLHLRSRFNNHTPTVQRLVAKMSDEELIAKWHAHRTLTPKLSSLRIISSTSVKATSVTRDWWTRGGALMRCDQCEAAMINGVFCHETGCPNTRKTYRFGAWLPILRCPECDGEVEAGTVCDCQTEAN